MSLLAAVRVYNVDLDGDPVQKDITSHDTELAHACQSTCTKCRYPWHGFVANHATALWT